MNTGWLLLGLVFSSVGMGYCMYGKKQSRPLPLVCGLALVIYPYFIASLWAMAAIGVALMAVPILVRR